MNKKIQEAIWECRCDYCNAIVTQKKRYGLVAPLDIRPEADLVLSVLHGPTPLDFCSMHCLCSWVQKAEGGEVIEVEEGAHRFDLIVKNGGSRESAESAVLYAFASRNPDGCSFHLQP